MAKRSDFAQKLLDDLRVRRERMATTPNSDKSTRIRADAYSTAKQIPRGSRDMKTQGNIASRARKNTHASGNNRLPYKEESSNQVIPYSRGQSSHHIGDLSMALAFALENGGKLRSTDFSRNSYMVNFLHYVAVTATDQKQISCSLQSDHRSSFTKSRKQGGLTESESRLKQILISSELFLNFTESLFNLNIPTGILEIGIHHFQDEESTVKLECSLEIMKRKGKRQELLNHPCTSISMRFKRIRSLDGLVKQLHDDFEMLKFYGRKGRNKCPLENYLPKMLETDLNHRNPDLNCMWDLEWNERMFSFIERDDVIRGVEKHVLSGLVDEITRDLFYI